MLTPVENEEGLPQVEADLRILTSTNSFRDYFRPIESALRKSQRKDQSVLDRTMSELTGWEGKSRGIFTINIPGEERKRAFAFGICSRILEEGLRVLVPDIPERCDINSEKDNLEGSVVILLRGAESHDSTGAYSRTLLSQTLLKQTSGETLSCPFLVISSVSAPLKAESTPLEETLPALEKENHPPVLAMSFFFLFAVSSVLYFYNSTLVNLIYPDYNNTPANILKLFSTESTIYLGFFALLVIVIILLAVQLVKRGYAYLSKKFAVLVMLIISAVLLFPLSFSYPYGPLGVVSIPAEPSSLPVQPLISVILYHLFYSAMFSADRRIFVDYQTAYNVIPGLVALLLVVSIYLTSGRSTRKMFRVIFLVLSVTAVLIEAVIAGYNSYLVFHRYPNPLTSMLNYEKALSTIGLMSFIWQILAVSVPAFCVFAGMSLFVKYRHSLNSPGTNA